MDSQEAVNRGLSTKSFQTIIKVSSLFFQNKNKIVSAVNMGALKNNQCLSFILHLHFFLFLLCTPPSPSPPHSRPFPLGVISNWTNESRIPPCTISQAFQYFLDITTPPSPALLQQFAALATSDKHKRRLEVLSKVSH